MHSAEYFPHALSTKLAVPVVVKMHTSCQNDADMICVGNSLGTGPNTCTGRPPGNMDIPLLGKRTGQQDDVESIQIEKGE